MSMKKAMGAMVIVLMLLLVRTPSLPHNTSTP
jgi:hypothetical protein